MVTIGTWRTNKPPTDTHSHREREKKKCLEVACLTFETGKETSMCVCGVGVGGVGGGAVDSPTLVEFLSAHSASIVNGYHRNMAN